MHRLIFIIGIIANLKLSQGTQFIVGLNERLECFSVCNIRITAEFQHTEWDPLLFPVALVEVHHGKIKALDYNYLMWKNPVFKATIGPIFKYRDSLCMLDLVVHPSDNQFNLLGIHNPHLARANYYERYTRTEYLVFLWHHDQFMYNGYQTSGMKLSSGPHNCLSSELVKLNLVILCIIV